MSPFVTSETCSQFSVSVLSKYFASHTEYLVHYKVISYAPTALTPSRNLALFVYITRSDCVSHYYLILSTPTRISSQSDCVLPYPYHINLSPKGFSRTDKTWLFSPYLLLYQSPYLLTSNVRFECLFTFSTRSKALDRFHFRNSALNAPNPSLSPAIGQ